MPYKKQSPRLAATSRGPDTESLTERPKLITCFSPQVAKCAAKHDALWYANRPGKVYRLRPIRRGEIEGVTAGRYMLIRRIGGERIATTFQADCDRKEFPTTDTELAKLWDLFVKGLPCIFSKGRVIAAPVQRG